MSIDPYVLPDVRSGYPDSKVIGHGEIHVEKNATQVGMATILCPAIGEGMEAFDTVLI
jgi:hypothetical protein